MKRNQEELVKRLNQIYRIFAHSWEGHDNFPGLVVETYEILIELKEIDPIFANEQAQWLIQLTHTWTVSNELKGAYEKWIELEPLFMKI